MEVRIVRFEEVVEWLVAAVCQSVECGEPREMWLVEKACFKQ